MKELSLLNQKNSGFGYKLENSAFILLVLIDKIDLFTARIPHNKPYYLLVVRVFNNSEYASDSSRLFPISN